jgi:hypothetical protein
MDVQERESACAAQDRLVWSDQDVRGDSCRFDVRDEPPPPPPSTTPPPTPGSDLELEIPPHVQCYRGSPRGYAFVAPHDMQLTGVRWAPLPAPCGAAATRGPPSLHVQVALLAPAVAAPGPGVTWSITSDGYILLANYSGAPPPTASSYARSPPDGPGGGGSSGGGWVGFDGFVPKGRTVAVWGHLDGYVSYAGSASQPLNGAVVAHHPPSGNTTGNISLWRLVASGMAAGASLSLENGPSFGRWRLSYRLATPATTSPATPAPPPATTPPPPADVAAARQLVDDGVVCALAVSPMDLRPPQIGLVDHRLPVCDDRSTWPAEGLRARGGCYLAAPAGTSSALVLALSGTGEVQWVTTAQGGDVELRALAHSQAAVMAASDMVAAHVQRGGSSVTIPWSVAHVKDVMRQAAAVGSVIMVGEVRGAAVADFGRTIYPDKCSHGRRIGEKGLVGAAAASACAGQVRGQGSAGKSDVLVVRIRAADGQVVWVRRTGLVEREESVTSVAVDGRGDAYILGAFAPQAAGLAQGPGDDGSGSDVFGMAAARRIRAVGCDADPQGYPRCTLRAHSPSDDGSRGTTTAFLVKMAGESGALAEGSAGREGSLSLWGHVLSQPTTASIRFDSGLPHVSITDAYKGLVLEVVAGSGKGYVGKILSYDASTHDVSVTPPLAAANVLDGSSRVRIVLLLSGKVSEAGSSRHQVRMDSSLFPGSDGLYVGMLFRIR